VEFSKDRGQPGGGGRERGGGAVNQWGTTRTYLLVDVGGDSSFPCPGAGGQRPFDGGLGATLGMGGHIGGPGEGFPGGFITLSEWGK